jgi:hypothetical protein
LVRKGHQEFKEHQDHQDHKALKEQLVVLVGL